MVNTKCGFYVLSQNNSNIVLTVEGVYTSKQEINQTTTATSKTYKCRLTTQSGVTVESTAATIYLTGITWD